MKKIEHLWFAVLDGCTAAGYDFKKLSRQRKQSEPTLSSGDPISFVLYAAGETEQDNQIDH